MRARGAVEERRAGGSAGLEDAAPVAERAPAIVGPLAAALLLGAWLSLSPGQALADGIHEGFDGQTFDSILFRIQNNNSGGRWDLSGPGLRAIIPPGPKGRQPLALRGQFQLEGDFRVALRYEIEKLPLARPGSNRNNIEIYLANRGGFASLFRTAAKVQGQGFNVEHPATARADKFRIVKTNAPSGVLELRREGSVLRFSAAGPDGLLVDLGTADFDTGPITHVSFQAVPFESTEGLDVRFRQVDIEAGKIVRTTDLSPPGWGRWMFLLLAAVVAVVAVVVLRRRRGRPPSRPPGPPARRRRGASR